MALSRVATIHGGKDAVELNITYTPEMTLEWLEMIYVTSKNKNNDSVSKLLKIRFDQLDNCLDFAEVVFYFYYLAGATMKVNADLRMYVNTDTTNITKELLEAADKYNVISEIKEEENQVVVKGGLFVITHGDVVQAATEIFKKYNLKGKVAIRGLLRSLYTMFGMTINQLLQRINPTKNIRPNLAKKAALVARKDGLSFNKESDSWWCSDIIPADVMPDNVRLAMEGVIKPEV